MKRAIFLSQGRSVSLSLQKTWSCAEETFKGLEEYVCDHSGTLPGTDDAKYACFSHNLNKLSKMFWNATSKVIYVIYAHMMW